MAAVKIRALVLVLACSLSGSLLIDGTANAAKTKTKHAKKTCKSKKKRSASTAKRSKSKTKCKSRKRTSATVPATQGTVTSTPTETPVSTTSNTLSAAIESLATLIETAQTTAAPAETTSPLAAPTETAPVETTPVETIPTETTPTETVPVETVPTETTSSADTTVEPEFASGEIVGTISSSSINEASGIVASQQNPDVFWVHNDSGDSARVFAINASGDLLGTYTISGVTATDWEDIALGPGPTAGVDYLYIGDIGDNSATRSSGVNIYRVPEPAATSSQATVTTTIAGAETMTVQYPSGARDAETLMIDPTTSDIYVLSKRTTYSEIYRLPDQTWSSTTQTLEYQGALTYNWAVGGEISADGDEVIVKKRSSDAVYLYDRPEGMSVADALASSPWSLPYTVEPQGEAVSFDAEGSGYYTISEGSYQPLYYYQREN